MMSKPGYRAGRDQASLAENIELLTGQRGDRLDKAITYRELADIGLITLRKAANSFYGEPAPGVLQDESIERPVAPTGVIANGAFHTILVEWDSPAYRGHAYAEVWRAEEDNLSKAVLIGTAVANMFSDAIGKGSHVWYWVRFVSRNNIIGPWNGVAGTEARTSRDVQEILDELEGKIAASHLVAELLEPIQSIPAIKIEIPQIKVDLTALNDALDQTAADLATLDARETQVKDLLLTAQDQLGDNYLSVVTIQEQLRQKIDRYNTDFQDFRTAVFSVDPTTGQITMDAINGVRSEFGAQITAVSQHLNAVEGVVNTCVTRAELAGDLERITSVEQEIDGINATLTQKATKSEVTAVASTVTQVSQELDATKATLTQKAAQTQVDSQGQRLTVAEQQITANASATTANAQRIEQVKAQLEQADSAISASITQLSQAMVTADQATATRLSALESTTGNQNAAISELQQTITGNNQSLASKFEDIKASIDITGEASLDATLASAEADRVARHVSGQIRQDQRVMVSEQEAQAKAILELAATFETANSELEAHITSVQTALTSADQALASKVDQLKTDYQAADTAINGSIASLQQVVSNGDSALAQQISSMEAAYKQADTNNSAAIQAEATARASADGAISTRIDTVQAKADSASAAVQSEATARTSADTALSNRIDVLQSSVNGNTAAISSESTARSNADSALSTRIDTAQAKADSASAAVQSESTARANADGALSTRIDTAQAKADNAASAVQSEASARASADTALSNRIDTVQATANNTSATVQTQSQAIANLQNGAQAMWTAKANAGQITTGIGLIAKSDGTSQVAISASQVFVFDPNSPNQLAPLFAIDAGQTIIADAIIRKATIQILTTEKITADYVKAGVSISSPIVNGGQFDMGNAFMAGGAAGFGKGGPYSGFGFGWYTIIYADGAIYTNRLNAQGGSVRNMTIGNCVIEEDCVVRGTFYAERIVGDIAGIKWLSPGSSLSSPSASLYFAVQASVIERDVLVDGFTFVAKGDYYGSGSPPSISVHSVRAALYCNGSLIHEKTVSAELGTKMLSFGAVHRLPAGVRGEYRVDLSNWASGPVSIKPLSEILSMDAAKVLVTKTASATFG